MAVSIGSPGPVTGPTKHFHDALHDFLCMARDRSQAVVLQFFLEQVVHHSDLCGGGSILVHVPESDRDGEGHLKVWDFTSEDPHIHSLASLLASNAQGAIKSVELPSNKGICTVAFRKRAPEFAPVAIEHPQYWWPKQSNATDIYAKGPCYSVPIQLTQRRRNKEPFGVVNFQNRAGSEMKEETFNNMNLAVKALEAMMSLSPSPLVEDNYVFIVHGRDEQFRRDLETILEGERLTPVVIQSQARTGADLLSFLEEKIRNCLAGFILLTPDDEGRLYEFGQQLRQRARQNVLFEAGYLTALFRHTNRICFLQKGELEIPSDLNGLLMETARDGIIDAERIRLTLKQWGLHVLAQPSAPAAPRPALPPAATFSPPAAAPDEVVETSIAAAPGDSGGSTPPSREGA